MHSAYMHDQSRSRTYGRILRYSLSRNEELK